VQPDTQYAKSGDVSIAYQVVGEGPFDVVFAPGIVSHLDLLWEMRTFQTQIAERLASFARLILFDKRGTGMSDRVEAVPQLETRMDDVRAVMDAAGSPRAALVGVDDVAVMGLLFAAAYPERAGTALDRTLDEIEAFLTEVWQTGGWEEPEPERVLATVLFTDIVGSTEQAAVLGDRAWNELLQRHHELVRRQLVRFRGREVNTAGDGFVASFDGPARAIRCAQAIIEGMHALGLEVRTGLHTGECELVDGKVAGIAVHTGARVASEAAPGEVLVSSTVKDLVAGSGLAFHDRGAHELKGVPGEWRLFAVDKA
jgi:class 3 adenylate cyclase